MNTPIIDPSTLTEEQRDIIKEQYEINNNPTHIIQNAFEIGIVQTFEWLFGKEFFEKGE